jgi:hypothetical protein
MLFLENTAGTQDPDLMAAIRDIDHLVQELRQRINNVILQTAQNALDRHLGNESKYLWLRNKLNEPTSYLADEILQEVFPELNFPKLFSKETKPVSKLSFNFPNLSSKSPTSGLNSPTTQSHSATLPDSQVDIWPLIEPYRDRLVNIITNFASKKQQEPTVPTTPVSVNDFYSKSAKWYKDNNIDEETTRQITSAFDPSNRTIRPDKIQNALEFMDDYKLNSSSLDDLRLLWPGLKDGFTIEKTIKPIISPPKIKVTKKPVAVKNPMSQPPVKTKKTEGPKNIPPLKDTKVKGGSMPGIKPAPKSPEMTPEDKSLVDDLISGAEKRKKP